MNILPRKQIYVCIANSTEELVKFSKSMVVAIVSSATSWVVHARDEELLCLDTDQRSTTYSDKNEDG